MRDKLVTGIMDRGTKGKILREKSLTLDKAIDIVRSSEITSKQLETMKSDTVTPPKEEVNLVGKDKGKNFKKQSSGNSKERKNRLPNKNKPKADPGNTGKCKNCGSQHKRNESPAYNKRCAYCQKWHYFASVCMAKKKGVVNFVQESQDSSDSEESVLKVKVVSSVESCGNR